MEIHEDESVKGEAQELKKLSEEENINFNLFDTTNKNQRKISFEVVDCLLKDMRKNLLNKAYKEFDFK